MTSQMTAVLAREHTADLRRSASHAEQTRNDSPPADVPSIELRLALAVDAHQLTRLAQLDDAPELEGSVLLAFIDGRAEAALSLSDRRIVANPFVRTQEAVTLLRMRAALLTGTRTPGHRAARIRARFAGRFGVERLREHARVSG